MFQGVQITSATRNWTPPIVRCEYVAATIDLVGAPPWVNAVTAKNLVVVAALDVLAVAGARGAPRRGAGAGGRDPDPGQAFGARWAILLAALYASSAGPCSSATKLVRHDPQHPLHQRAVVHATRVSSRITDGRPITRANSLRRP